MLELILGTDWKTNRQLVLERIASDVKKRKTGVILMVPELISHDMERRLAAIAGDTASRYAEVLSFTRLARRVAEAAGAGAQECLDNGGRVVAMASAVRQLKSRLKAYAAVETKPEFLTELVDAVDEFKRCCISSRDLLAAADQTEGSLAQKLEELSLIMEAYDGLCQHGKRDPRDQMTWLLEQLEDGEFAREHKIYVDGFPDFTRQHLAILEELIQSSDTVVISLNCDHPGSAAMAFETAGRTAKELISCAQHAGIPWKITNTAPLNGEFDLLWGRLFQGKTEPVHGLSGRISLYQAESTYQECQAAALQVLRLVQNGCRYRDISVVCTDMAVYGDLIQRVFHQWNIPVYQSGTEEILTKTIIVTVLSALEAALEGFERQDVLRYLKSVLSPLDLAQADQVENYAILWGIYGNRWTQPWTQHPGGLNQNWTEKDTALLQQLEQARITAITPLVHLRQRFDKATCMRDQIRGLYDFLEEISLAERMQQLADQLDAMGDNRSAQILNQLWEILLGALEQMYDVLGNTSWDAQTFTRLLTLLLSQYDVGTIPPVLDAVMTGPVTAMRCQMPRHLFVLGAVEGSLPGYGGSKGLLTDQERVALRQMGVPLTGGAMEGLQAEFAEIYGVFCGALETVTVSCGPEEPSFVYRRLKDMVGQVPCPDTAISAAGADPASAAAFLAAWRLPNAAKSLGLENHYQDACRRRDYTMGAMQEDTVRKLYGKKLNLSASQVDRQAECRLSYFLRYGLRAKERKEATVDAAEFGIYVHAVLEQTARKVMELGGFHKVDLETTLSIAREYSDVYTAEHFDQLDSQRLSYLFRRNLRELEMVVEDLWQELSRAAFAPVDFETRFGSQGRLSAIPIPGGAVQAQLEGFIDRVDAWQEHGQNYFRVVDYKTGRKDFDYCDVHTGVGLQMLIYLFALERSGEQVLGSHPVPAGVQYFPARAPLLSADGRLSAEEADKARQSHWKRSGLLLEDEQILRAMQPENAPQRLCCKWDKNGNVSGDLASRQQLSMLKQYLFGLLSNMVNDIASGNVEANPYTRGSSHDACAFCPYAAVCHKTEVTGRRNYQEMDAQRFWEEIGKELHHGR